MLTVGSVVYLGNYVCLLIHIILWPLISCYPIHRLIDGRIDEVNQVLLLSQHRDDASKYHALQKWAHSLSLMTTDVFSKLNN